MTVSVGYWPPLQKETKGKKQLWRKYNFCNHLQCLERTWKYPNPRYLPSNTLKIFLETFWSLYWVFSAEIQSYQLVWCAFITVQHNSWISWKLKEKLCPKRSRKKNRSFQVIFVCFLMCFKGSRTAFAIDPCLTSKPSGLWAKLSFAILWPFLSFTLSWCHP